MSDIKVGIIADDKTSKGIKSAQKNIGGLDKSVTNLAKTFAGVFAAQKILAFGKASAQAFAEDQAAIVKLSNTVKNLGLGFAAPEVENFIQKMQDATGVIDDQLRPAMQGLLTTTGSIEKSQKLLANAIDISRGSGVDLITVAQDLSNAYVGNTKGLKKYNLGLTAAQLKAASFNDIQEKLNKQFSGSSAKYLETYAGKMEKLNTAFANAKENIGKGILDSLALLGGQGTENINSAADAMNNFSTKIGNAIYGLSVLIDKLGGNGQSPKWLNKLTEIVTFGVGGQIFNKLADVGAKAQAAKTSTGFSFFGSPMEQLQKQRDAAAKKKAEEEAARRARELLKAQQNNTKEIKRQAALKKAGTVFDIEQIQLVAALKGKLSEDDKRRAEAQLALLAGNAELATKLTNQIIAAQDASGNLADFLSKLPNAKNPFAYLDAYIDGLKTKVDNLYPVMPNGSPAPITGNTQNFPQTNAQDYSGFALPNTPPSTAGSASQFGSSTPWAQAAANFVIQIDGKEIAAAVQNQSLNGNGSAINRALGSFS